MQQVLNLLGFPGPFPPLPSVQRHQDSWDDLVMCSVGLILFIGAFMLGSLRDDQTARPEDAEEHTSPATPPVDVPALERERDEHLLAAARIDAQLPPRSSNR